jgi:hypothetical protein
MSLPLSIRLSGLAFQGVVAVAYEGDRKRLHVTILDGNEKGTASGHNLLRKVVVESEVGQTDKLVLKDMVNIEQFVLDVARKALEVSLLLLCITRKPDLTFDTRTGRDRLAKLSVVRLDIVLRDNPETSDHIEED